MVQNIQKWLALNDGGRRRLRVSSVALASIVIAMSSSTAGRSAPRADSGRGRPSNKMIKCDNGHDIGHAIEDEASAKRKLREAGFNPESVSEPAQHLRGFMSRSLAYYTPMIYFSYMGDLPMCRYLYLYGGKSDVTKCCSNGIWFPMYAAAKGGSVAICKWLYEHGAAGDICRSYNAPSGETISPLVWAGMNGHGQVCQWLILKGAFHGKPGGAFDEEFAAQVFGDRFYENFDVMPWIRGTISCYEAFHVFLLGTLPLTDANQNAALKLILTRKIQSEKAARIILEDTAPSKRSTLLKELLPLRVLSGVPGVLEKVADFAGVIKSRRERQRLRDIAGFCDNNGRYGFHLADESSSNDGESLSEDESL